MQISDFAQSIAPNVFSMLRIFDEDDIACVLMLRPYVCVGLTEHIVNRRGRLSGDSRANECSHCVCKNSRSLPCSIPNICILGSAYLCRYRIDRIPSLNHVRTGGANSFLKDNRADDLRQGCGHA